MIKIVVFQILFKLLKSSNPTNFEGVISIEGIDHMISCNCGSDSLDKNLKKWLERPNVDNVVKKCYPNRSNISIEKKLSDDNIEDLSDKISQIYGQKMRGKFEALNDAKLDCTDNRVQNFGNFFLGGETGILLLILDTINRYRKITGEDLGKIFFDYKSYSNRKLTYCTDEKALKKLAKIANTDALELNYISTESRPKIKKFLIQDSNYQGNIFFKDILNNPENYQIDPNFKNNFLDSFFENLWVRPDIYDVSVQTDEYKIDQPFVVIKESKGCSEFSTKFKPYNKLFSDFSANLIHYNLASTRITNMISQLSTNFQEITDWRLIQQIAQNRLDQFVHASGSNSTIFVVNYIDSVD